MPHMHNLTWSLAQKMITLDFDRLYKDEMIHFIPFNEI